MQRNGICTCNICNENIEDISIVCMPTVDQTPGFLHTRCLYNRYADFDFGLEKNDVLCPECEESIWAFYIQLEIDIDGCTKINDHFHMSLEDVTFAEITWQCKTCGEVLCDGDLNRELTLRMLFDNFSSMLKVAS